MSQSDDDWLEFTVPPTSPPRSTGSSSFPSRRNTITDQDFDFSSRRPSLSTVIHKAVTSLATETTPSPVTKRARAVNTLEDEIHNIGDSGMIAIGSNSTRTYPHRRRDKDGARARSKSRDLDPPETPHSYSDLTADTNAITSLTSVHSPKLSVIAPEEVDLQNIQQVAQRTRGRNQKSLSTDTSRDSSRSASASRAHSNSASRNRSNSTSRAHSNSPSPHSNSRTSPHSNSRSSPHSNSRANDNNESAVGTGSRLRSATAYSKPLSRPPSVNTVPSKTSSMQSPRGKANKQDSGASQNQSPNMFSFPLSKGSTAAVVQNQGVPGWSDLAISSPNGSPRPSHPLKRRRAYTQHAPPSADLGTLQNDAAEHSRTSNPGAQTRAHVPLTSPQDGVVNTNISPLVRGTYRNVEPLESRGRQSTTSYETSRGKSPRSGTSESADKRVTRHTRVTDQSMSQGIESKTGAGSMGPLSVGKGCSEDDLTRLEIEALGDLHSSSKEGEDFDWHNTGMQDARLEIRFDREGNQLKVTILQCRVYTPNVDYVKQIESQIIINPASRTHSPFDISTTVSVTSPKSVPRMATGGKMFQAPKSYPHLEEDNATVTHDGDGPTPHANAHYITNLYSTSHSSQQPTPHDSVHALPSLFSGSQSLPVGTQAQNTQMDTLRQSHANSPHPSVTVQGTSSPPKPPTPPHSVTSPRRPTSSMFSELSRTRSPLGANTMGHLSAGPALVASPHALGSSSGDQHLIQQHIEVKAKFKLEVFISTNNKDTDGDQTDLVETAGRPIYRSTHDTLHRDQERAQGTTSPHAHLHNKLFFRDRDREKDKTVETPMGHLYRPDFKENEFRYPLRRGVGQTPANTHQPMTPGAALAPVVSAGERSSGHNTQAHTTAAYARPNHLEDTRTPDHEAVDCGSDGEAESSSNCLSLRHSSFDPAANGTTESVAEGQRSSTGDMDIGSNSAANISRESRASSLTKKRSTAISDELDNMRRGTDASKKYLDDNSHLTFVMYMGSELLGELYIPIRNVEMSQSAWYHMSPADNSFLSKMRRLERHRKYQPWHGQDKAHPWRYMFRKSITFNVLFTTILVGQVFLCVLTTAVLFTVAIKGELYNATTVLALEVQQGIVFQLTRSLSAVETLALNSGAYLLGKQPNQSQYNDILHYQRWVLDASLAEAKVIASNTYISTPQNDFYGYGNFDSTLSVNVTTTMCLSPSTALVTYPINYACNDLACPLTDQSEVLEVVDPYVPTNRSWWALAVQSPVTEWTDVYDYVTEDNIGVTCVYRIPNELDRPVEFVFAADVRLGDLNFILEHNYNSEYLRSNPISFVVEAHTSRILLASRELPYNSKYNRIRESYLTQAPLDLLAFSKWSEGTERVTGEFLPPTVSDENCTCTVEEMLTLTCNASCTQAVYDQDGDIIVMSAYELNKDSPWLIVVIIPAEEYQGAYKILYAAALLVVICATIMSVIVSGTTVSRVSSQLGRTTKMMKNIATLNLDPQLEAEISRVSPIKEVARLYDVMHGMQMALTSFFKYVPADVIKLLMRAGYEAKLGGEKRYLTIFFSDIVDFTRISEQLDPETLIDMLGVYLSEMSNLILEQQGTVDKYIGDAVMAMWNAPETVLNHAYKACRCALLSQQRLMELREGWKDTHLPAVGARIGIHTGYASVGNFGSKDRLTYTALGDTVNFAARLEALNKEFGTEIIISETTYSQVKDQFVCRPLDIVSVTGSGTSSVPMVVYELIGDYNSVTAEQLSGTEVFTNAFQHYRQGRYSTASRMFKHYLDRYDSKDIAAHTHISTCRKSLLRLSVRTGK